MTRRLFSGKQRLVTGFLACFALQKTWNHRSTAEDAFSPPGLYPSYRRNATIRPCGGKGKIRIDGNAAGKFTDAGMPETEPVDVILLVIASKNKTSLRSIDLKPAAATVSCH